MLIHVNTHISLLGLDWTKVTCWMGYSWCNMAIRRTNGKAKMLASFYSQGAVLCVQALYEQKILLQWSAGWCGTFWCYSSVGCDCVQTWCLARWAAFELVVDTEQCMVSSSYQKMLCLLCWRFSVFWMSTRHTCMQLSENKSTVSAGEPVKLQAPLGAFSLQNAESFHYFGGGVGG